MAMAASGSTTPVASSSMRHPLFKSAKKDKEQPPTPLEPLALQPLPSSSRHKPSSSRGGSALPAPAPNLLSKREDRKEPMGGIGSSLGGIGITGFVKGGNGDGLKGKGKPEMVSSRRDASPLRLLLLRLLLRRVPPLHSLLHPVSAVLRLFSTRRPSRASAVLSFVLLFFCRISLFLASDPSDVSFLQCGTITDIDLSHRRAAGLPKQSDPFPLSISRFRALLDTARSAPKAPSSPSGSSFNLDDYDSEDVEEARTIEGDSAQEEEDEDVKEARTRGGGGLRPAEPKEKEEWWVPIEAEIYAVFSHWSSLSASFSNVSLLFPPPAVSLADFVRPRFVVAPSQGVEPSLFDSGVDMIELRAFYELLSILPAELGQAVVKGLEGLLRRPRRRFDSGLGPKGLSWVSRSLFSLPSVTLSKPSSSPSQVLIILEVSLLYLCIMRSV